MNNDQKKKRIMSDCVIMILEAELSNPIWCAKHCEYYFLPPLLYLLSLLKMKIVFSPSLYNDFGIIG